MKVCFIGHSAARWGAELCLLDCVTVLAERGITPSVIVPAGGPLVDELRSRGVAVEVIAYRWWANGPSRVWKRAARMPLILRSALPVAAALKRSGCDIVCTNTITVPVGAFAAKLLRIPHVWWIHEFGYRDHGLIYDLGTYVSLKLMNRLSRLCVANSYAVAEELRQTIPEEKLRVVYYRANAEDGLFPESWMPAQGDADADIRCVFVGSLGEGKRPEDAIRAIAELVRRGRKPLLYVVGSGTAERESYLRTLVAQQAIESRVAFLGYVDKPFEIIRKMDCLLMCSRAEAFGRVTLEAMAAGIPVVGAAGGATLELISDGLNGLLYGSGAYLELADKIEFLAENPGDARRMGESGKRWAFERFGKDRYAKEILGVLKEASAKV